MPKHKSYGPVIKGRARAVLEALLRNLKSLIGLMMPNSRLNETQIKEVLKRLQDLEILEDNRVKTQGSGTWIFTLKLWSRDRMENLKRFDLWWDQCCQPSISPLRSPADPPQIPLPLQALIRDLTAEFVGRQPILRGIDRFLRDHSCGYLWLHSAPGSGKTACLAEYVRRTGCVAYLPWQASGDAQVESVIECLCDQLMGRFVPTGSMPYRDPQRLASLLHQIGSAGAPEQPVVIAIDGADQIESLSEYLPASLPQGVFVLLTCYPNSTPPPLLAPHRSIDLDREDPSRDQALQDYIQSSLGDHESGTDLEGMKQELVWRSGGNFRYVRHVLKRYRESNSQLEHPDLWLPRSLFPDYERYWRRMQISIAPYPRFPLRIAASLAFASHAISCLEIAEQVQVDPIQVQSVLEGWSPFLRTQQEAEELRYTFFHASFQSYLRRKPILQVAHRLMPPISHRISTTLDSIWGEGIRAIGRLVDIQGSLMDLAQL